MFKNVKNVFKCKDNVCNFFLKIIIFDNDYTKLHDK